MTDTTANKSSSMDFYLFILLPMKLLFIFGLIIYLMLPDKPLDEPLVDYPELSVIADLHIALKEHDLSSFVHSNGVDSVELSFKVCASDSDCLGPYQLNNSAVKGFRFVANRNSYGHWTVKAQESLRSHHTEEQLQVIFSDMITQLLQQYDKESADLKLGREK